MYYCPNGIPDIKGERRKEKGESKGLVPEILFLSHLIVSKGVLVLLDTFGLLMERGVDFHCTIAGGDAELTRETVEEIIRGKGLETFISVVGPKHNEEKIKLLELTDIFVHPSFNDCMPLILLEAMQTYFRLFQPLKVPYLM